MQKDKEIFRLIDAEKKRQIEGIELIASENFTSDQVMAATGSILTNKYAEGYPGKRYYGGCQVVDEIESLAISRAMDLFGACWANVQPHSGSQANSAVFFACLNPGDTILGFDLSHGGHLTHGSSVNFSGRLYNPIFYGVDKSSGMLDYEEISKIAKRENPKMIIAGASAYSRDIDFKKFREIADSVGALLLADIYGLKNLGTINGMSNMYHQIGGALCVFLTGEIQQITGSYQIPFVVAGFTLIFASIISFSIREKTYSYKYNPVLAS